MIQPKTITIIIAIFITLIIVIGLLKQIKGALEAAGRLDTAADEVSSLQEKNTRLKEKLLEVQQYRYIEEMARDKLNLAKEGEVVVIIDPKKIEEMQKKEIKVEPAKISNWQGWLKLFLK